jgi:hypothetical protein
MPQLLQTARDPFTLGRSFDEDSCRPAPAEHLLQIHPISFGPSLNQLTVMGEDANLAVDLVNVDTDVVQTHGSPPLICSTRVRDICGALSHHGGGDWLLHSICQEQTSPTLAVRKIS